MKGLKSTLIATISIGLLAGSAVGVAAQDSEPAGDEPTGTAYFTGELRPGGTTVAEPDESIVDGVLQGRGWSVAGETIETSDPRVSGSLARVLNANVHKVGDFEEVVMEAASWRIENDEGSWSGHGSALVHGGAGIEGTNLDTILLTGEGAYEGLTAYVLADWSEDPVAVEGAVLVGEAPPAPEPAPASEPEAAE